ncbi:hypothetical protein AC481_05915 [miscellaneous Crenarchaeota group archaeon SMTZ-80]|nr:MAG: hypothetical protein AC481_05915 [miscellaneous Crenarchaeota group archaeon SMTZ-80]
MFSSITAICRANKHACVLFLPVIFSFILFLIPSFGYALYFDSKWEVYGYLKNETALRVKHPHELMKSEFTLEMDFTYHLADNLLVFLKGKAFYDTVFDWEDDGYGKRKGLRSEIAKPNQDTTADPLREAYIDIFLKKMDIRIGKQQEVWGTADGLKVLDLINPTDFREFYQDDFEDSRIPLWAFKVNYYVGNGGNNVFQVIWIPDFEPDYIAPYGHPFAPLSTRTLGALKRPLPMVQWVTPLKTQVRGVAQNMRNSEIGFKWSQNFGSWEYTLNYFYHWNDNPGLYFKGYGSRFLGTPLLYEERFKRVHSLGGTFSKTFTRFFCLHNVVMRGEFLLNVHDSTPASTPLTLNTPSGNKTVLTDSINYVIGWDKQFRGKYFFSLQFFQFITLDYHRSYLTGLTLAPKDRVDNAVSLLVSSDFFHEGLKTKVLMVYLDDGELWIQPRFTIELTTNVETTVGGNFYTGSPQGILGEFRNNNQVVFEIKYGF